MTGFVEGAYIDDERAIHNADGSPDDLGRYVDDRGYLHLANGDLDGYWFIDAQGQPHDGQGTPKGEKVGIPQSWSVFYEPPETATAWQSTGDDVAANAIMQQQIADRNAGLSDTAGTRPGPGKLAEFVGDIPHTAPATDAAGGDLTWAGGTIGKDAPLPGQRALNAEYVGEDQRSAAFAHDTKRGKLGDTNTQWTTEYDSRETDSVEGRKVTGGLLCDQNGTPLNGTFGYVVDPNNGRIYTFNQGEGYVSKSGTWIPLAGLERSKALGLIQEALTNGEQVSWVHHSTPVAGQPVAGAGQLTVANGKITAINDESGHYKPEGEYLWQTITWLAQQGMPIDDIDVTLIAKGQQAKVILDGWKFAQTGGNQQQAKFKQGVIDELDAKTAAKELQEKIASFRPGSAEAVHYQRFTCADLDPSDDGSYCMTCDKNL